MVRLDMQFMEFAKGVCNKATDRGHWADYIDPCSGLPVCLCSTKLAAWMWLLCSCNLPASCYKFISTCRTASNALMALLVWLFVAI